MPREVLQSCNPCSHTKGGCNCKAKVKATVVSKPCILIFSQSPRSYQVISWYLENCEHNHYKVNHRELCDASIEAWVVSVNLKVDSSLFIIFVCCDFAFFLSFLGLLSSFISCKDRKTDLLKLWTFRSWTLIDFLRLIYELVFWIRLFGDFTVWKRIRWNIILRILLYLLIIRIFLITFNKE